MLIPHLSVIEVNIMEARNFITAREMVSNNNWILTTINDLPRYEKPPLPTWLTAIFGLFIGFENIFGLRLPVVFITLLLVFSTYKLSEKLGLSKQQNFHNGLILITSFYIYFAGRDNQWDMYTHSFMMVCIVFLWKFLNDKNHTLLYATLAGLFFGFSFLSKGPISVYALLLPFLIAYGIIYKFDLNGKKFYVFLILLIGFGIGLSWPLYVRYIDPETVARVTKLESSRWGSYNIRPFYYYWSFFTQSGIWTVPALIALFYPYLKTRVSNLKAYQFTLIWTLASLVLLSIIPEKKSRLFVLKQGASLGPPPKKGYKDYDFGDDLKEDNPTTIKTGVIPGKSKSCIQIFKEWLKDSCKKSSKPENTKNETENPVQKRFKKRVILRYCFVFC